MPLSSLTSRASIAASFVVLLGYAQPAHADDKLACIQASDSAQQQRQAGHLTAARESALRCVRDTCPGPVRAFCEQWMNELAAALPTVVLRVADASGRDVADVRVLVDGVVVATKLDGRPLSVDPGLHVFRFEPVTGTAVEDRLLIVESQKNRIVFETLAGSAVTPTPAPVDHAALAAPADGPSRPIPAASWALGAVAVAGLAGFTALSLAGSSSYQDCVDAPCSSSTRSSLGVERALAWTSLGVAAAAAAGSLGFLLASRSHASATAGTVGVVATPEGGFLSFTGRF